MTEPFKKAVNWEKITALCSMLVALCALLISIWQGYSMQQHNQLSLRPYLETELNTKLDGRWELFINNNGLGPAHVNNVQYFVDGKSYENIGIPVNYELHYSKDRQFFFRSVVIPSLKIVINLPWTYNLIFIEK